MGKQLNYFMDYISFRAIAGKALELGAVIVPGGWNGVRGFRDLNRVVLDETRYLFYFPEQADGASFPHDRHGIHGNATIEAGFSEIKGRTIHRERMYITTGYYDRDDNWIPRPKDMDGIYNVLVRFAKKQLLYKVCSGRTHKDNISPAFDELVETMHHVLSDF